MSTETVTVNKAALVQLLRAFTGHSHEVLEIRATINTPLLGNMPPNPVRVLMDEVQAQHDKAAEPEQEPTVTDEMAFAFQRAITDAPISGEELEQTKIGLRNALANFTSPRPREWRELSDEEALDIFYANAGGVGEDPVMRYEYWRRAHKAISAALRAKNGG